MIGGASMTLIDTAGLRATDDIVEAEGVRRSIQRIEDAGIVVLVLDGSEPNHPDDDRLVRSCVQSLAAGRHQQRRSAVAP